ncbi:MAG: ABC-F family ATP-binding cassette domain-containing protein [Saprospiraceae bacterium]|nr:ABC-F family ATP-binding cassette domain-containing protein [Saprospiraceae bacterium]
MLQLKNIYVKYGDRILLDEVSATISDGEKLALVGRNGAGKSTLLKIIARIAGADSGEVDMPRNTRLAYLRQEIDFDDQTLLLHEAMKAFEELNSIETNITKLEMRLHDHLDEKTMGDVLHELEDLYHRRYTLGGDTAQAETEKVLTGLGFKPVDFMKPLAQFSGGWKMRVELAKMLLCKPDILMLDEPTNHLDMDAIIWLEGYLHTLPSTILTISHDRQFLDNVSDRTLEIEQGKLNDYAAGYSKYLVQKVERDQLLENAFNNQQKMIAQRSRTIDRFRAKASKAKMAQSMLKQLDKIERVEWSPTDLASMVVRFPPAPRSGEVSIEAKQVSKSYGEKQVLEKVDFIARRGDRIAFVGQNGQGKTTFVKILTQLEQASGGQISVGYNTNIGYYAQNQAESLALNKTLLETLEEISPPEMRPRLRAVLGAFLFSGDDVDKKVSVLSGGERARLAMACMLLRPINLLILDEPTNHLDIDSKEVLKEALLEYEGTLIVVSHDREFLQDLTDKTIEFKNGNIKEYLGDIQYYLSKREIDNFRDLSKTTPIIQEKVVATATAKSIIKSAPKVNLKLEKEIEKLEKEIADLETKMAEEGFYEYEQSNRIIEKYQLLKKSLDQKMETWMNA